MFGKKRLSKLDIKSIILMLNDFNITYPDSTNSQKEYFLANTLEEFGVKTDSAYSYGCIPPPPFRSDCNSPNKVTTTPPKGE